MGWIKRILPTAAGPGLIVMAIFVPWIAYDASGDTRLSAFLLGNGLGGITNPAALVPALIGVVVATRWIGALGFAVIAAVLGRSLGLSRIDPFSWPREIMTGIGIALVALVAIAIGYAARAALLRWRSARS
jgi:hypothetical protein